MLHYNEQLCELIHGNTSIIKKIEEDIVKLEHLIEKENERTGKHVHPLHISYNNSANLVDQFDELLHILQGNYNQYLKLHALPSKHEHPHHHSLKWLQFK